MRHLRKHRAFTLIELLAVIAVIAILSGLLVAGVSRVRQAATRTMVITELAQASTAASAFAGDRGEFPMLHGGGTNSTFRLCTNYTDAGGNPLTSWPEVQYLKRLYPRIDLADTGLRSGGSSVGNASPILLDANQSFVFWLSGGTYMNFMGHSTNNAHPFTPFTPAPPGVAAEPRKRYFDFPAKRMTHPTTGATDNHWRDPWGTPYACFAYDKNIRNYPAATNFGVSPFVRGDRPENNGSTQIISAGPNTRFGPGGNWTPGSPPYESRLDGGDDLSNFRQTSLGEPE